MRSVPMIFPGQGSQAVGMAADLMGGSGPGSAFLAAVDGILGEPLTRLMREGPLEVLTRTVNAQPAILAHSVAVLLELRALGVQPSIVAGHSLGEFSAAVAAGALAPEDALRLVRRRGELMYEAGVRRPGAMAAVLGLARGAVEAVCRDVGAGIVVLANHNSALQTVVSGDVEAVAAAGPALTAAGARRVVPLQVSGAFHSPLLQEAAETFAAELARVPFRDLELPLVANVDARPLRAGAELRARLARQMISPVLWHDGIAVVVGAAEPAGGPAAVVLEVGPGQVLANLARRDHPALRFAAMGTRKDLDSLETVLPAAEI